MGLILAPLILIDAFILRFLFKPEVRKLFQLPINTWKNLEWTVSAVSVLAAFLFVFDLVNDIVAIVLAISLLFAFRVKNRYKKKLEKEGSGVRS